MIAATKPLTSWEDQERAVEAARAANEAMPPPWPVGTRVRHPGGRFRRGDAPWVDHGAIGTVVEVREGLADPRGAYSDADEYAPLHGASVVEFPGGTRVAIAQDMIVTDPDSSLMRHGPYASRWMVVPTPPHEELPEAGGLPYFRAVQGPDGTWGWGECPRCAEIVAVGAFGLHWEERWEERR